MRTIVITIFVSIALGVGYFVISGNNSSKDYNSSIFSHRQKIDDFMQNSSQSPFLSQKIEFPGLSYFAPDSEYLIEAKYIPIGNRKIIRLATSDGKEDAFEKYGYANFQFQGKTNKLLVLKSLESTDTNLFIPFSDLTSGTETYGGGRYLNVTLSGTEFIQLDFNKAYNPYCAYSEDYSCPLPPRENRLQIDIIAGEKYTD